MKAIYFLLALGVLVAVAYARPIEDDEPLEDELMEGNYKKNSNSFQIFESLKRYTLNLVSYQNISDSKYVAGSRSLF